MNGCFNCAHQNSEKCKTCRTNIGELWEHEVKTNADKIRSMMDDEIEEWYWWMHKEMMRWTDSRVFVHNWLKQDAEGEE